MLLLILPLLLGLPWARRANLSSAKHIQDLNAKLLGRLYPPAFRKLELVVSVYVFYLVYFSLIVILLIGGVQLVMQHGR